MRKKERNNQIVWVKQDSEITCLVCWEKPFACERCGKETHLTSIASLGIPHPVCEECYPELHAYHLTVATTLLPKWRS